VLREGDDPRGARPARRRGRDLRGRAAQLPRLAAAARCAGPRRARPGPLVAQGPARRPTLRRRVLEPPTSVPRRVLDPPTPGRGRRAPGGPHRRARRSRTAASHRFARFATIDRVHRARAALFASLGLAGLVGLAWLGAALAGEPSMAPTASRADDAR